ncbi:MAG: restriction endonuclease subunit S [Bacteroidales bacterium]|nr:restriction endonuclease subunit S [Bacteroidales bacterium]
MAYTLPKHIDSNKIFLVNKKDIEGSFHPEYYNYGMTQIINKLKSLHKIERLCDVANFSREITTNINDGVYIGLENIESNTGDYISTDTKQSISSANVFAKNSILFPKLRPYLNKVYFADLNGICSTEFMVINAHKLLPEFLAIYLRSNIILSQTVHMMTGNTLPRLQTEDIYNLPVPILSKDKQQQIIDLYNTAYNQKKAKEQQAKELLSSIDDYLLNELGITLPNIDNSLPSRIFIVNSKEISNSRFDPKCVLFLGHKMKSCIYDNIQLKDITFIRKGSAITSNEIDINGIYPVIAGGQTSPYNHNKYNYKGNVITISASGAYAGYVWYHKNPIFASDCSVIYSKEENSFCTRYIFEVLKAQQNHIYLLQTGAGQPHVYPDDLAKLWIPIVTLEKQKEIADHITEIRQKAKQLQEEAKQLLQQTKTEIEQMILE